MKHNYLISVLFCWLTTVVSAQKATELPLFDITQLTYEGGFRIDAGENGNSSINYSQGPIAYNYENNSVYIVGHTYEQAIAEYAVPEIVKSEVLSKSFTVKSPMQVFSSVLNRTPDRNPQDIDRIGGMLYVNHGGQGKLIVNGYEYYDASGTNTQTTLIVNDANDLQRSAVDGFYTFEGGAGHTSGWISPIPQTWQKILGGTHLTGQASGIPIISRLTVGPSAFSFNIQDALNATDDIATTQLMDFSLDNPLHEDLDNAEGENDIWTHLSNAKYGFIVPGTRTYLTLGSSGGHESGVCYKCTQDNGNICGGYCPPIAADTYQYYWLWDINDLVAVKDGAKRAFGIRPYDYGKFRTPFQNGGTNGIGGGSFDAATGTLYLTVQFGDTGQGVYARPPVVVIYHVNGAELQDNSIVDTPNGSNPSGDNPTANSPRVTMYPNPTSAFLSITGLNFSSQIRITDISGKNVAKIDSKRTREEIDLSGYAAGMYAVSILNKETNEVIVEKVIKQE